jgi:hypothetical protein
VPRRSVARACEDHVNSLLSRTVTDARPTVIGDPSHAARFMLACQLGEIAGQIAGQIADSKDEAGYAATAARLRVAASVFGG